MSPNTQTEGACKERAVIWYNLPKINQLVQDA
ncbi:excisionase family protein [Klebsiella pneumoniae]|nr:excisionase family protein [Klebsiella pneumoniae]